MNSLEKKCNTFSISKLKILDGLLVVELQIGFREANQETSIHNVRWLHCVAWASWRRAVCKSGLR
jgi:hypothetical protein